MTEGKVYVYFKLCWSSKNAANSLRTALRVRIAQVAIDADTDSLMFSGIAKRMHAAVLIFAGILTSPSSLLAISVIGAILVTSAFYYTNCK